MRPDFARSDVMKILVLHTLYWPHVGGGAETVVRQVAEGLQQRGHEVSVLATGPQPGLHQQQVEDLRVYRAGLANRYWHFTQQRPHPLARLAWHCRDRYNRPMRRPLAEVIASERPDIVLCNNLTGWSISAWDEISAAGLPIVQVLHDLYLLCPRDTMFKKGHSCARQCLLCSTLRQQHARASGQVAAVIGVSRFLLEQLEAHGYFANARRHVVHNRSAAPPEGAARQRNGQALRFGYLGTLAPNKGVGWLIEQFQRLPIEATLDIAGRGKLDDEAHFRSLVTDPQRVRFVGYQETDTFLAGIDVLVVPSLWQEPFGLVAVEGCARHLPVIASTMGGLPEIVQDRVNGLLCDTRQPDSLGQAMLELYQDEALRQRLAAQARRSVAPLLDTAQMIDAYERILEDTLNLQDRSRHEQRYPLQTCRV